ncbi:MAG: hypothetical protein OXL36_18945 [Bryobacterales bacterium]|nr:hypothetical protein [Bryobacterales bacterium]
MNRDPTVGTGTHHCEKVACISHHPTVEEHDTTARTSLRLLAVLDLLFTRPETRISSVTLRQWTVCESPSLALRHQGPVNTFASSAREAR